MSKDQRSEETPDKLGIWRVLKSVLAAFFGVQSQRNYLRDFSSGRYWPFIVIGVLSVLLFILIVYLLVLLALQLSVN